jgi:antitoxin (DNA-binding transcriptional repressor) of toxin-antitoxin stability system
LTTLTVTEARKNLTRWLLAAARGDDVTIISGADIIALRKVEVEPTDYAWREYGVTTEEVARYEQGAVAEHRRLQESGTLEYLSADDLRRKREEAARD